MTSNSMMRLRTPGLVGLAVAGIVGAGACTSSSGNESASPPSFDAGLGDVTFQDTGVGADGSTTFSLAGCLAGALSAGGASCGPLETCVEEHCGSQLASCFGSGWDAGTVAPGSSCASLATCAMNSTSCTKAAGLACFDATTNSCQCCVQDIATCTRTNCAVDMLGCSTNLLGALPSVTCCAAGQTACSGACVDEQTDSANCGACAHACTGGQACQAGTCTCPTGTTLCSGTCVDEQTENANCGACGNACATGQTCVSGKCTTPMCTSPEVLCLGTCVNEQTDSNNCGACDNACAGGQTCVSGTCTSSTSCLPAMVSCGGSTINSCTSQQYCGASGDCMGANAGMNCTGNPAMGAQCIAGMCQCPAGQQDISGYCTSCNSPSIVCGNSCIDPTQDPDFCGASGNCQGANVGTNCTATFGFRETCVSGQCVCASPYVVCGGQCIDPTSTSTNCGASGNCQGANAGTSCLPGYSCASSVCTCAAPDTICPSTGNPMSCNYLQSDPQNCGACGHSCLGGTCSAGVCQPGLLQNMVLAEDVAVDANSVYFSVLGNGANVYSCGGLTSCASPTLVVSNSAQPPILSASLAQVSSSGGWLYYVGKQYNSNGTAVLEAKETTTGPGTAYVTGLQYGGILATDATNAYYSAAFAGSPGTSILEWSPLSPPSMPTPSPAISGLGGQLVDISVDPSQVYVLDATNSKVVACALAHNCGATPTTIASGLTLPSSVSSNGASVFIADSKGIHKCPTTGCTTNPPPSITNYSGTQVLADANNVYFNNSGTIYSCSASAATCTTPTTVVTPTMLGGGSVSQMAQLGTTALYLVASNGSLYVMPK
jgi:hypothetical protein